MRCCRFRGYVIQGPIVALVLALLVPSLTAWGEPITISLVPVSTTIELDGPNDPLVVDVRIANPDQELVKSWTVDLFYDDMDVFDPLPGIGSVPAQGFELGDYISGVSPNWNNHYVPPGGEDWDRSRMGVLNIGASRGSAPTGLLARVALDPIATPGCTLSLQGQVILDGGPTTNVVFESTQITVGMPEPATAALFMASLFVIWRRRRPGGFLT